MEKELEQLMKKYNLKLLKVETKDLKTFFIDYSYKKD